MSKKSVPNDASSRERRKALEVDLQSFFKSGKQIEQVPTGVSGQDRQGRSKHIVLSRGKKR